MSWIFDPLPLFGYDLLTIDVPWHFDLYSEKGEGKSAQAHYDCMPLDEIARLPVGQLVGADAWIFSWATAPLLPQAIDILEGWGFVYVSRLTWRKVTKNGKVRMGPGYVVRTCDETVLVGRIGRPRYAHALPSLFDGVARQHSRKPDEFFRMVEGFAPNARRADIFGREQRPGWTVWGNETTKFEGVAA
jgi:N6-adenosine-specific RNA methylase IME4